MELPRPQRGNELGPSVDAGPLDIERSRNLGLIAVEVRKNVRFPHGGAVYAMTDSRVNYDCRAVSLSFPPMAPPEETMGQRILRQLEVKNINQSELARILDVSRQTVNQWVTDTSEPTPDNLINIAHVLFGDDVHYLVHGAPRSPPGGFPGDSVDASGRFVSPFRRRDKT